MCRHRHLHRHDVLSNTAHMRGMQRRRGFCSGLMGWLVLAGLAVFAVNGCVAGSISRHEVETEITRTLPTVGTRKVSIKTDNGFIQVRPAPEGTDTIQIHARIRVRGENEEDAQAALAAVEITTPVAGPDESTQEISWAWSEPRERSWQATVSFEVSLPPDLELAAQTENGKVDVVGIVGDCWLKSENGEIRAVAAQDELQVETTNGALSVESPASDVKLKTVNGRVKAKLTNEKHVAGQISTENGEVRLELAKSAGVELRCRTSNGRIKNSLPLEQVEKKGRTRLTGRLAGGGESLEIETSNGGINLAPYTGEDKDD